MLKALAIVALLASPALAQKKKKDKGEDAPPPAPAEQAPKKNKNKDKQADAPAEPPPPADAPKGDLKPGQGVGRRVCLGSTSGIGNIEVTSNRTVGVATCNGELKKVFLEKGICKGKPARTKVEYGWQFADTTGKDTVSCP
jgi:hypothetical protein